MTIRYYLSASGQKVPQATTEDHADIGRRILAGAGIIPRDYADIYEQMECLGYFRVVEFPERVFAENSKCPVTSSQMEFLLSRMDASEKGKLLLLNDELFPATRRGGNLSHESLNEKQSADRPPDS